MSCDRESLSAVRIMHERELFGGRVGVGAERLRGEPVMRAERVRSMWSSAVVVAERAVRVPFVPLGRLS